MTYRIGLIGVGIIGEPVVRGLIRAHGDNVEVRLSPRNTERAAGLAAEFANVRVEATNQDVLDSSDWIVLAVPVPVAEQTVRALKFRPGHHLVSLVTGVGLAALREWSGVSAVVRMTPLPYVVQGVGPVATYPLTPDLAEVFGGLGTLTPADDESGLATMSIVTSTQSAFFAVLAEVVRWAHHHGLPPETAQGFTIDFYSALLSKAATLSPADLAEHWREMTPGGYNHTAVTTLGDLDAITAWTVALDAVQTRDRKRN